MLASEITLADRGRFVKLTANGGHTFGLITTCAHGDPAVELADGDVYHFIPDSIAEFVTEDEAVKGSAAQLLEALGIDIDVNEFLRDAGI